MWLIIAGVSGALAVSAGAFGAHALKARLAASSLSTWQTGAEYHLLHSVVLLAVALYSLSSGARVTVPALLFSLGIVLFSGSLYWLALGGPRWLGPVTPLGGLSLVAGWLSLVWLAAAR